MRVGSLDGAELAAELGPSGGEQSLTDDAAWIADYVVKSDSDFCFDYEKLRRAVTSYNTHPSHNSAQVLMRIRALPQQHAAFEPYPSGATGLAMPRQLARVLTRGAGLTETLLEGLVAGPVQDDQLVGFWLADAVESRAVGGVDFVQAS